VHSRYSGCQNNGSHRHNCTHYQLGRCLDAPNMRRLAYETTGKRFPQLFTFFNITKSMVALEELRFVGTRSAIQGGEIVSRDLDIVEGSISWFELARPHDERKYSSRMEHTMDLLKIMRQGTPYRKHRSVLQIIAMADDPQAIKMAD